MKILKIMLFVLTINYTSTSFAQHDTVQYNILRNDPKGINNLFIYAMPLNIDYLSTYANISYGFGAEYNYKDKFILGVDFKRSYTEKLNDLISGDIVNSSYSKKGQAKDMKNFMVYEFSVQYLVGGKIRIHNEKPVLSDGINSNTYIKIKNKHYIALALRASYAQQQYDLTNVFMDDFHFYYTAYNLDAPNVIFNDLAASTMYTMQFVSFGLGVYQKQDLKISTDTYGTKDYAISTTYYFDVLLPISQQLSNVEVTERKNTALLTYEANLNEHTPMTNYGFRLGMKWQTVPAIRKINGGSKFEIGFLPGPDSLSKNFFIAFGLDLNLSFNTQK